MKVSIITPVYNANRYIDNTYKSVSAQTHTDWEWLIIDDRSTDDSWKKISDIQKIDKRIKVFQNATNSGPSHSRNVGLENASGEYISFLDADDEWLPEKLSTQLSFMIEQKCSISCHSY